LEPTRKLKKFESLIFAAVLDESKAIEKLLK